MKTAPAMARAELLETLAAVGETSGVYFEDDGRYLDWSGNVLELGTDGEGLNFEVSRADLVRIHAALTRHLLQTAE